MPLSNANIIAAASLLTAIGGAILTFLIRMVRDIGKVNNGMTQMSGAVKVSHVKIGAVSDRLDRFIGYTEKDREVSNERTNKMSDTMNEIKLTVVELKAKSDKS